MSALRLLWWLLTAGRLAGKASGGEVEPRRRPESWRVHWDGQFLVQEGGPLPPPGGPSALWWAYTAYPVHQSTFATFTKVTTI